MIAFTSSTSAECRNIASVLELSRCRPEGSVERAIAVADNVEMSVVQIEREPRISYSAIKCLKCPQGCVTLENDGEMGVYRATYTMGLRHYRTAVRPGRLRLGAVTRKAKYLSGQDARGSPGPSDR